RRNVRTVLTVRTREGRFRFNANQPSSSHVTFQPRKAHIPMKSHSCCGRLGRSSACLLALWAVSALRAQTTPTSDNASSSASAAANTPNDSSVIMLTEFQVNSEKATGYRATNSITATGIGVESYQVPLQIMSLTSEYLKDTAALDMRDAV